MTNKPWHSKALELHHEGYSYRAIGRELGKDESVVRRYLNKLPSKVMQVIEETKKGIEEIKAAVVDPKFQVPKELYRWDISPKDFEKKPLSIIVIADTQCKPGISLDYCKWIGEYIFDKKPDVVVHIGDHGDLPSLSSYDKGKKSFEGRRLKEDLEAAKLGMDYIVHGFKKDGYNPRMVFCMGNHEFRLDRLANEVPELSGFVGTELLNLEQYGWEVYPFLKPAVIENIFFVHYLANPFTGKPYGGTAMSQLKTVGNSFVVGHKQVLDVAIRPTLDGKHQIGIINGAAYDHYEEYKGYTGNNHFRGLTVLHEVQDGFALPSFVSLNYLKRKYS